MNVSANGAPSCSSSRVEARRTPRSIGSLVDVLHLADRFGRAHQRDGLARLKSGNLQLEERRERGHVAHERPVALAAEAAQAVLDVGEEALARLLAVVADVDAGVTLLRMTSSVAASTCAASALASTGSRLLRATNTRRARRARQAAGMRGEDARVAALHVSLFLRVFSSIFDRACNMKRRPSKNIEPTVAAKPMTTSSTTDVADVSVHASTSPARGTPTVVQVSVPMAMNATTASTQPPTSTRRRAAPATACSRVLS